MFFGAPLDLFFFCEQAFEFRIGLTQERLGRRVLVAAGGCPLARGRVLRLAPPAATRTDHAALTWGTGGFADCHRGLACNLVFDRALVRKDLALVDPDLHADTTE